MWDKIKVVLRDHADADPRPNNAMIAFGFLENWKEGYPVHELDVVNECFAAISEMDADEYYDILFFLNRRYFELA